MYIYVYIFKYYYIQRDNRTYWIHDIWTRYHKIKNSVNENKKYDREILTMSNRRVKRRNTVNHQKHSEKERDKREKPKKIKEF